MKTVRRQTRPEHIAVLVGAILVLAGAGGALACQGTYDQETTTVEQPVTHSAPEHKIVAEPVFRETEYIAPEPEPEPEPEPFYHDIPLTPELQDFARQEAEQRGVPPELILAMMDQESDYRTSLISTTNDYGIMQINKANHAWLRDTLGITDFLDPEQNIRCGIYMIGELLAKYDGDLHRALTSYNRGEGGANKFYSRNGTYETSYSRSILEIYNDLTEEKNNAYRDTVVLHEHLPSPW